MYPVKPEFKVTFSETELPPIQVEGNKMDVNFSLTIPEVIYLALYIDGIKSAVDTKANFAFMSAGEKLQRRFVELAEKRFNAREFSPEELNLDSLVTSIWMKARIVTEGQCLLFNEQDELADEKKWQDQSSILSLYSNLKGYDGKWFTARQLNLFKNSLEDIAKTSASNKV